MSVVINSGNKALSVTASINGSRFEVSVDCVEDLGALMQVNSFDSNDGSA